LGEAGKVLDVAQEGRRRRRVRDERCSDRGILVEEEGRPPGGVDQPGGVGIQCHAVHRLIARVEECDVQAVAGDAGERPLPRGRDRELRDAEEPAPRRGADVVRQAEDGAERVGRVHVEGELAKRAGPASAASGRPGPSTCTARG
jgi:hypothetical protein